MVLTYVKVYFSQLVSSTLACFFDCWSALCLNSKHSCLPWLTSFWIRLKKPERRKEPELYASTAHSTPKPKRKHKNSNPNHNCISCVRTGVVERRSVCVYIILLFWSMWSNMWQQGPKNKVAGADKVLLNIPLVRVTVIPYFCSINYPKWHWLSSQSLKEVEYKGPDSFPLWLNCHFLDHSSLWCFLWNSLCGFGSC